MVRRHKERKFGTGCEERWELERPALQTEAERLLSPFDLALAHRPFLFDDQPIFSDFALSESWKSDLSRIQLSSRLTNEASRLV